MFSNKIIIDDKDKSYAYCVVCGKRFKRGRKQSGGYSLRLFCSDECNKVYNDTLYPPKEYKCQYCGKTYTLPKGKTKTKYCSDLCLHMADEAKAKTYPSQRICKFCGKEFKVERTPTGNYSKRSFCSVDCEKQYNKQKSSVPEYVDRVCEICGKTFKVGFAPSGTRSQVKYCSDTCEKIGYNKKTKETNLNRYGVEHTSKLDVIKKKQRDTLQQKYGTRYFWQLNTGDNLSISKINQEFEQLLLENGIVSFDVEYKIDKYSFDFILYDYNLIIDINPTFSHSIKPNVLNWFVEPNYHYDRRILVNKRNYKYISIWDWDNKQDIVNAIVNDSLKIIQLPNSRKIWSKGTEYKFEEELTNSELEKIKQDNSWWPIIDDAQQLYY